MRKAFGAAALICLANPLSAQAPGKWPPDSFSNLQVLPRDIKVFGLIGTMRNFIFDLGVRCGFCHEGKTGQPIAEFDFGSDEKRTRQVARQMAGEPAFREAVRLNPGNEEAAGRIVEVQGQDNTSPSVSPDGRLIAFVSRRDNPTSQLYVIAPDGSGERQVTSGKAPVGRARWSHDGKRLEFGSFAHDTGALVSVALDGSGRREEVRVPGRGPSLLPDGRRVLYATGDWTTMQLMVAGRDGKGARRISDGTGAIWGAALSPDGKRIAYGRYLDKALQVWVMNVDGSGARQLTRWDPADGSPQMPAWSSDGRRLAIQVDRTLPGTPAKSTGAIWVIDVATGAARQVTRHDATYLDELPAWFPDGRRIAFQSDRTGRGEIWVVNADGTGERRVTGGSR